MTQKRKPKCLGFRDTKRVGIRSPQMPWLPVVVVTRNTLVKSLDNPVSTMISNLIMNSSLQTGVDQTWLPSVKFALPAIEKVVSSEMEALNWLSIIKLKRMGKLIRKDLVKRSIPSTFGWVMIRFQFFNSRAQFFIESFKRLNPVHVAFYFDHIF